MDHVQLAKVGCSAFLKRVKRIEKQRQTDPESHHMVNYRDGRDRSFVMQPQEPGLVMKVLGGACSPGEAHE
jgi:hypothetical protein